MFTIPPRQELSVTIRLAIRTRRVTHLIKTLTHRGRQRERERHLQNIAHEMKKKHDAIQFLARTPFAHLVEEGIIIIQLLQKKTVIFSNQIHVSSLRRGHAIGVIELISTARCNELRNVVPNLLCIFIRLTNAIAEAMAIN